MRSDATVLVVGAGPAGVAASVSAARLGAHVTLVEKEGRVGGLATTGLVAPMCSAFFRGEQVVRGIFQEVVEGLQKDGGGAGHVLYSGTSRGWGGAYTPFDPAVLQRVEVRLLLESGVRLLLHTHCVDARTEDGYVTRVQLRAKSTDMYLEPSLVVDATGDADVAATAGFDYQKGRESDGLMQPASLMMRVGGVDTERLRQFVRDNPREFAWSAEIEISRDRAPSGASVRGVIASGFRNAIRASRALGELYFGRSRFAFSTGLRRGEVFLNATRVNDIDGTSSEDLTRAEIDGRAQAFSLMLFLREHAAGFEDSWLIATGPAVGVRETRRIVGQYELTLDDVIGGAAFEDGIAVGGYPVDVHEVASEWGRATQKESVWIDLEAPYDVPFRCLVPRKADNLLVAGRCISCSHEALGSARVQPIAMATGEAAGAAAAMACTRGLKEIGKIDVADLREQLARQGAYLRDAS